MSNEYVINHLRSRFSQRFHTLDRGSPFTLVGIFGNLIIITTSSGTSRNVPLDGTISSYKHIMKHGELSLSDIREHKYSDWNPTYIAALLTSFSEIDYTLRPIKLLRKEN